MTTIGLLVTVAGCQSVPERMPGGTLTNAAPTLRQTAFYGIRGQENPDKPGRGILQVIDTRVVEPPQQIRVERTTGMKMTTWAELWTVQRRNSNVLYRVEFDLRGSQGEATRIFYMGGATNRPAPARPR